jgi:hypothetical protein
VRLVNRFSTGQEPVACGQRRDFGSASTVEPRGCPGVGCSGEPCRRYGLEHQGVVVAHRDLDCIEREFRHSGKRTLPDAAEQRLDVIRGNDYVALARAALALIGEDHTSDRLVVIVKPEELAIAVRGSLSAPPPLEISRLPHPGRRVCKANAVQKLGDHGEVVRLAHRFFPQRH